MIKIIPNNDLKIEKIEFSKDDIKLVIELQVLTVVQELNPNNIGTILEKYRNCINDPENYFETQRQNIETFIYKTAKSFDNFNPDFLMCFLPRDENRQNILQLFKDKILPNLNPDIDFSNTFYKKDNSKSIKKNNLTKEDFILNIKKSTTYNNVLIIDDVIDEGKTVDIFLNKMLDSNLINYKTKVKMACLYNRPKIKKLKNPLKNF